MKGLGVDVVDLDRFAASLDRRPGLVGRLFTADERAYCDRAAEGPKRIERYAARFAVKEAAMKALGVGLGAFGFHDVALARAESGSPSLVVQGRALELADDAGVAGWHVSISHSHLVAVAVVAAI